MKLKRMLSLLIVMLLVFSMFTACGSSDTAESEETEAAGTSESENTEEDAQTASADSDSMLPDDYPVICDDGSMTLTIFAGISPSMSSLVESNDELYFWQEVCSRTGVALDWNMASSQVEEEQFNLLVAADDLPNIVGTAQYYTQGITSAVDEEIFVDLSLYLSEYAPDYLEVISQDNVWPIVSDDNGSVIGFYEVGMEEFSPNNGMFLRGDLLEEQGLDVPVTYDEWEEVLLTLKDAYDLESPLYAGPYGPTCLSFGLGVIEDFSLDADGSCIYGPVEDAFREYLSIASDWYAEGLIYQDYYSVADDSSAVVELISTGESAAAYTYCDHIGNISLDDGEYLVAAVIPRSNADDEVHLTDGIDSLVITNRIWALGTNSTEEEIQAACMLINYLYTEEGALLANYGVEGLSFEYQEDGTPWYTDLILDNPDGLTQMQAMGIYLGVAYPCYSDYTKYNISALTTYADFIEVWSDADNDWAMPSVSLTVEENESYAAVSADVETYQDEAIDKFIIGAWDVNDDAVWEEYVETMKSLGVDTMIEIYTAALERYNAR